MTDGISAQDLADAFARVGATEDGHLLYLWAQKALMALPTQHVDEGGLREHHGRRMLLAEIVAMLSEGIKLSGRSSSSRPIVFAVTGGTRTDARPRFAGPGRRVSLDTPVAGYDADPNAPDRHPGQPDP